MGTALTAYHPWLVLLGAGTAAVAWSCVTLGAPAALAPIALAWAAAGAVGASWRVGAVATVLCVAVSELGDRVLPRRPTPLDPRLPSSETATPVPGDPPASWIIWWATLPVCWWLAVPDTEAAVTVLGGWSLLSALWLLSTLWRLPPRRVPGAAVPPRGRRRLGTAPTAGLLSSVVGPLAVVGATGIPPGWERAWWLVGAGTFPALALWSRRVLGRGAPRLLPAALAAAAGPVLTRVSPPAGPAVPALSILCAAVASALLFLSPEGGSRSSTTPR